MVQNAWAILLGTGKGEQITPDTDTGFLNLGIHPVITYSLTAFEKCPDIEGVAVVVPKDRMDTVRGLVQVYGFSKVRELTPGSNSRSGSLQSALKAIDDRAGVVVVHEVSRPCVTPGQISDVIKAARKHGAGITGEKINGNLKLQTKGAKAGQAVSEGIWRVQTPQAYKADLLQQAYAALGKKKLNFTDESELYDVLKKDLHMVEASFQNIKLSSSDELTMATSLLR
ncbi:MAG: 2-C-methyl-D-erythritol 4-phosphate cytidylyltransferase [Verrucomicrobiota bacterium]